MKDFVIPFVIALLGLAATGLGAVVGARAARFGAEKSAETVRRQVRDQGAIEHGHWLSQQRFSTYESFLEAWDECLRVTQTSAKAAEPDPTGLEDLRSRTVHERGAGSAQQDAHAWPTAPSRVSNPRASTSAAAPGLEAPRRPSDL